MSESKKDRSIAPRVGTRPSRAKETTDRNVTPPKFKFSGLKKKPKKGERVMEAQLADKDRSEQVTADNRHSDTEQPEPAPRTDQPAARAMATVDPEAPPPDPWWTPERELAFQMTLQGLPQHQVANDLGRDRHTVARWQEDERFMERLREENLSRFHASRQRRTMQTLRLTDKSEQLATRMLNKSIELAEQGKDNLGIRMAARDWLNEFREQSRREDEIYGLAGQRVDVNVHGTVQHNHKGKVDVSFKEFLTGAMKKMAIDVDSEEIAAERADDALVALTERALMEGSFLEDLVETEREEQLKLAAAGGAR